MYRARSREEIAESVMHLRKLYRKASSSSEQGQRLQERREILAKNLLSNLPRMAEHPTLRLVLEVADAFLLTLDGAHLLFGYDLDRIRELDSRFNGGRTHIIESYPFSRDRLVDLPEEFGSVDALESFATLQELVPKWKQDQPIRTTGAQPWHRSGIFYVHVGTEDSEGSDLPAGSTALVESVATEEENRPNPRATYLLLLPHGYRCSRCVVSGGKLLLLRQSREYRGPQEYRYPGAVRIVGRVRATAMRLPLLAPPETGPLPIRGSGAPLLLPWEHTSRDSLFETKSRRFSRSKLQETELRSLLETAFDSRLTERTERRYRRPSGSQPHVDTLVQMVLLHTTRYRDALRADGNLRSDRGRHSLNALLSIEDLRQLRPRPSPLSPSSPRLWERLRHQFPEWPATLSMAFPDAHQLGDRVMRLPVDNELSGLSPQPVAGSLLLLDETPAVPTAAPSAPVRGWSRPIYVLRRRAGVLCGFLSKKGERWALTRDAAGNDIVSVLGNADVGVLFQVRGIAIPF